jgi:hypothetical protein
MALPGGYKMRYRLPTFLIPVLLLALSLSLAACGVGTSTSTSYVPAAPAVPATAIPTASPTAISTLTPTAVPTAAKATKVLPAYGCLPTITILDTVVQACMDKPNPDQNDNLVVTTRMSMAGKPIAGAPVKTTWNYRTVRSECTTTSNTDGIGFCQRNIGDATLGYRVIVEVQYDYQGKGYRGETSFTPAGVAPPAVASAPTAIPAEPPLAPAPAKPSASDLSAGGQLTYSAPGCVIKGNASYDTGEKIYHVPGGQYYNSTKIDPRYGERWFCNEQDAINNGWRKSRA